MHLIPDRDILQAPIRMQQHQQQHQQQQQQQQQQSYGYVMSSMPTSLAPSARNSPPLYPQAAPQYISIPSLDGGVIYGQMPQGSVFGMPQPMPQYLPHPMGYGWYPQHHHQVNFRADPSLASVLLSIAAYHCAPRGTAAGGVSDPPGADAHAGPADVAATWLGRGRAARAARLRPATGVPARVRGVRAGAAARLRCGAQRNRDALQRTAHAVQRAQVAGGGAFGLGRKAGEAAAK
jgi:hypothetical protein